MNSLRISERMQAIGSMVLAGKAVADIGTDHGFVPADLLIRGVCPFAVLTDVNSGPLEKCRQNLAELGIDKSRYELRKGDGFEPLLPGEVATVIIAGMGGELIQGMFESILKRKGEGVSLFERAVLQPRTHEQELRSFLVQSGFAVCDYRLAKERGRICEVFAVEPKKALAAGPDSGIVSSYLLEHGDPLLSEYVGRKIDKCKAVLLSLENSTQKDAASRKLFYGDLLQQLLEIKKNL